MDFRNLSLDINNLERVFTEICNERYEESSVTITEQKNRNNLLLVCNDIKNNRDIKVMVYKNNNITTTLSPRVGTYQEESLELVILLKERLEITPRKSVSLCIANSSSEVLDFLIQFLVEDCEATVIEEDEVNSRYKIKGNHGDCMTLRLYTNNTLHIQGKPIYLYTQIFDFLIDFLDEKEILNYQNTFYNIDIKAENSLNELKSLLPNSHYLFDDKIMKMMSSSLGINKVGLDLYDYTLLVIPILKGIEAYLITLINSSSINTTIRKMGSLFNFTGGEYLLDPEYVSIIGNKEKKDAINMVYNYYVKERHSLFHVDDNFEATRVLDSKSDADKIIMDAIQLIDETSLCLKKVEVCE